MKRATTILQTEQSLDERRHIVQKWACLNCRSVTKMPRNFNADTPPMCSRCQSRLFFAGKAFRAPKRSDEKAWRKVALMLRRGYVFHEDIFRTPAPSNPNALPDWERQRQEAAQESARTGRRWNNEERWEQLQRAAAWRAEGKRRVREAREEN